MSSSSNPSKWSDKFFAAGTVLLFAFVGLIMGRVTKPAIIAVILAIVCWLVALAIKGGFFEDLRPIKPAEAEPEEPSEFIVRPDEEEKPGGERPRYEL